ncbi:PF07601 family protein [Leptospira interrogans str. HAI1594]|nr:PF07601 family protein [Leptospira interrogans str. HAI1594]
MRLFSYTEVILGLLKVVINKITSINRFHKTNGEFIFQKLYY